MFGINSKVKMTDSNDTFGTGWLPPFPDFRDYTEDSPDIAEMLKKVGIPQANRAEPDLPSTDMDGCPMNMF